MSDLGDLLELMYAAADRWRTLRCTVATRRDVALAEAASARWLEQTGGTQYVPSDRPGAPGPAVIDHRERLWIAKPDRWRLETQSRVAVKRGPLWWLWSPHQGYISNENAPGPELGDVVQNHAAHLDPAVLLPQIAIDSIERSGEIVTAIVRLRASNRSEPGLIGGADEYALRVDAQRGVVLRVESFLNGERFAVSELEDPVWDEELGDKVFTLELPDGETFGTFDSSHHVDMSLEEAAERVSFAVFAVAELPDGVWRTRVFLQEKRAQMDEEIAVTYHRADGRGMIRIVERTLGTDQQWSRPVDANEIELEREGTNVLLQSSEYDEAVLQRLGEGLVRV